VLRNTPDILANIISTGNQKVNKNLNLAYRGVFGILTGIRAHF
jgi:hypothetical protein